MKSELGQKGEQIAAQYLKNKGYKLLDQNFKTKFGEIDIVAQKGKDIIFIEVKTRINENNWSQPWPEESVTIRKRNKLRKLAEFYMNSKKSDSKPYQIDVIAVEFNKEINKDKIIHFEKAVIA